MAVPKRRTTRSKSKMRRAQHDKVTAPNLSPCSQCGEPSLPHRVCGSCGYFKGKQVVAKSASLASLPRPSDRPHPRLRRKASFSRTTPAGLASVAASNRSSGTNSGTVDPFHKKETPSGDLLFAFRSGHPPRARCPRHTRPFLEGAPGVGPKRSRTRPRVLFDVARADGPITVRATRSGRARRPHRRASR